MFGALAFGWGYLGAATGAPVVSTPIVTLQLACVDPKAQVVTCANPSS